MGILEYFRDWMSNNEEKKKFKEAWIAGKLNSLNWSPEAKEYHVEMAYETYLLTQRIEELEKSIK